MTLYILDTNNYKKVIKRYLIFTIIIFIFGIIYEMFSHQVYSKFMYLAFLIPLFLGVIFPFIIYKLKIKINNKSFNLYSSTIITLTVYSIIRGVLEIYGTTNRLINVYLIISIISLFLAIIFNRNSFK